MARSGRCSVSPVNFWPLFFGGSEKGSSIRNVTLLLMMAPVLLSGCSIQSPNKNLQPLPILTSMERMSRGGEEGVWMNSSDAGNLYLYLEQVERVCR